MPTIRALTPPIDQEHDQSVKVQVWVSLRDKRRILAAIGDDGVFTFIIRTQFQRIAEFVKTHDINSFDTSSFDKFVDFVRNGTDSRIDRIAAVVNDSRTTSSSEHEVSAATSVTIGAGKSRTGRSRKQAESKGKRTD